MVASSSGFLTRPAKSMYPDSQENCIISSFTGNGINCVLFKNYLTNFTIIGQVLQPVLRGLCCLLQPVAICPSEQVSESDEAIFPSKNRGSPAYGLREESQPKHEKPD